MKRESMGRGNIKEDIGVWCAARDEEVRSTKDRDRTRVEMQKGPSQFRSNPISATHRATLPLSFTPQFFLILFLGFDAERSLQRSFSCHSRRERVYRIFWLQG
jgi:hypothetical protein